MCFCERLTATFTRLSQLFFSLEKSHRLDFNQAFDLKLLHIIKHSSLLTYPDVEERQNTKTEINYVQDFRFFILDLWNLFRKIGN